MNIDINFLAGRIGEEVYAGINTALPRKRELFAAMAMQGALANPELINESAESMSEIAVAYADALIAELEKSDPR